MVQCTDLSLHVAGRFDEKIRIIRPDTKGRFEILKVRASTCLVISQIPIWSLNSLCRHFWIACSGNQSKKTHFYVA